MRRKSIRSVLMAIIVGVIAAPAAGGIIHVDDDAPLGGDGASWATAFRCLQDGLTAARIQAATGPSEIRLAQGIYTPDRSEAHPEGTGEHGTTFELAEGVSLTGGYAGAGTPDPNRRDIAAYATILSGDLAHDDAPVRDPNRLEDEPSRADNCKHVVTAAGPCVLDGITISGGHAWAIGESHPILPSPGGAGLLADGADVIVRDCRFEANFANEGGAVYAADASVLLTGCMLARNGAAIQGGAICSRNPRQVELANCLLIANAAIEGGGVLSCEGGLVTVRNCTAAANRAPKGGFLSDVTGRPARGTQPPWIGVRELHPGGRRERNLERLCGPHDSLLRCGRRQIGRPRSAACRGLGHGQPGRGPLFRRSGWDRGTPERRLLH